MKALYRRYRPKTLSEVVGQEQITSVLEKSIQNGKIAHAYLFIGPRGTGKTSVARILAHEINGFKYELEDDYVDIIEIDAASNTGVDNIRDLRERAMIAPTKGKYKVYIIDEVHMLSKSAFNALLKTLEEPPEHVIFIMATTDAYKVPVTITSRSQVFTFKLANPSVMFDHLKNIAKKEKIKITDDALKIVAKRGGGSFRDSLSLLDQISTLSDEEITAEIIEKALGLPQAEAITSILNGYASGDLARVREQLANLLDSGVKPEVIAENLITEITTNPQPIYLPLLDRLLDVSRSAYPGAKLLVALTPQNIAAPTHPLAPAPAPTVRLATAPVINEPSTRTVKRTTRETPVVEPKPIKTEEDSVLKVLAEPAPTEEVTESPAEDTGDSAFVQPESSVVPTGDPAELWNQVILHVEEHAVGLSKILQDSDYSLKDDKLTIYAKKKFNKTQIQKKISLISEILPDSYTIEVTDQALTRDAEIAAIAELMGGGEEVQIDA